MAEVDFTQLSEILQHFAGDRLTSTLSQVEQSASGLTAAGCESFLYQNNATAGVLEAAGIVKSFAGEINVLIHALGILRCLPHILDDGEVVEYVSLGAGNTGREFDLETNLRIAEFKFINWRGGSESIRQNSVFKDFFLLAESESPKRKFLYVLGVEHPNKFLNGGRALKSVLSKDHRIREMFYERYGDRYHKVRDYFRSREDDVIVQDVSPWLPELMRVQIERN